MENNIAKSKKIAVLVIDMQRDFIDKGAPIECPGGRDIIVPIQRLLAVARQRNLPVIYTQEAHRSQGVDFGRELDGEEPVHCVEGTPGIEIVPDLARQQGDFLIVKRRYSAFFATDLDLLLRGLNIDTLVLSGVATDVCVRATAQDAQQLNYKVIVPDECVAGTSVEQHGAALKNISYILGKVLPLDEIISMLKK
ncbi:MAG: cysteine hydrolase [Desulfobacterium sp.]|nr:cysteine hydrolase [Desulfobacterium sp.]